MKFHPRMALIAVAAAGALALTGCGSSAPQASSTAASGGTLTIGSRDDAKSFDPAQAHIGDYLQYYQPVYDSLLRRKPDGTLVPMLATKWSYDSSNTHLTLTLRTDVKFTDGTALDAEAVKVNLDRFRTGNGPDASTLAHVTDVTAKDAKTVELTLDAPDPALLDYLGNADGFIASPKAIDGGKVATDPVGSGPYTFDKAATVVGSSYTFVKNPNYWDHSLQVYDKIVVKPLTDPTAMLNALLSGQVNAAFLTAKTQAQAQSAGMTEYKYGTDWAGLLIFDRVGKITPALGDARVRQALNYAVDKESLLKQINGGAGAVTSQVFGPTTAAYDKSMDGQYAYDPKKAKSLLAEAGYANGFTVTMPLASTLDPALQAGLTQNFKDVGVTINWQTLAPADYSSSMTQGKFALGWYSLFQGTPWVAANQMLTPTATWNPLHTTDPTVESLVGKVQAGSKSEQDSAAKELNQYVTKQAWFAPAYRPSFFFYTDKNTTTEPQLRQSVPSIYSYAPKK